MIRVVIADDQVVVREGIKFIVEQDEEIEVVGCVGNGKEAASLCESLKPDLVLMDIIMKDSDGIEGTCLIKSMDNTIKVLFLTTFSDSENVSRALKNGADGYVLKDIRPEELRRIIKSTVGGYGVIQKEVFDTVIRNIDIGKEVKSEVDKIIDKPLTDREKSIIRLIVYGKTNKEIASILHLTEGRVKNIITRILEKLGLKDRTQLAVYSIKNNLV